MILPPVIHFWGSWEKCRRFWQWTIIVMVIMKKARWWHIKHINTGISSHSILIVEMMRFCKRYERNFGQQWNPSVTLGELWYNNHARIYLTPRYRVIALVAVTSRILKINLLCALANDAYNLQYTAEWLFNEALILMQKHLHKLYNLYFKSLLANVKCWLYPYRERHFKTSFYQKW